MNILVLGSTGFIGKNLVTRLRKDGHCVNTAERSTGVDLRDYGQTLTLLQEVGPDIIYNLASHGGSVHYVRENAAEVYHDNVQMALNLYKSVLKTNSKIKIIQPFSNCSYPGHSEIQKEEEWLNGDVHSSVFSFGNSKRSIFYLSECYRVQHNIRSVNILFPNTYGPGDSNDPNHTHALNGMIIRMLEAKRKQDKHFVVWGTGTPIREWAYIDDFITILIKCLDIDGLEYPINMGQSRGYSIKETANLIKEACNFQGDIIFDTNYKDGAPIKIMDGTNFDKVFKNFKFFDHLEGIRKTVKFYEDLK
tara:strand:+ start:12500 stop:13417 length:918 start_codon:yes stop_codon:yes gene_type:complete